jgi:proteasome accessory factor B
MMPNVSPTDPIDPLERLLNLVALLLDRGRPMTFEQIQAAMEGYRGENRDSAKRKFERDKDVLRDYGVPIELVDTDVWGTEQGYVIRKEAYYLPEIAFTPGEITALFVAAQSGTDEGGASAGVRKLLVGADGGVLTGVGAGPLIAGSDVGGDLVSAAADAATGRRRIRCAYRNAHGGTKEREIDAYAVVCQRGRWYLVGLDHDHEEVRAFRLSRFTSGLVDVGEGTDPPDGFRAIDHVQAGPWADETGERAHVAFSPAAASLALATFAGAVQAAAADERVTIEIPIADEGSLASQLLQFGPHAEVLDPPSLRAVVRERLQAMADA